MGGILADEAGGHQSQNGQFLRRIAGRRFHLLHSLPLEIEHLDVIVLHLGGLHLAGCSLGEPADLTHVLLELGHFAHESGNLATGVILRLHGGVVETD